MKDRQTVESRLKELRRESADLERKGLPIDEYMIKIATLIWVLAD